MGAVPIAGKLTDRLGPRSVLGAAIGFYAIGLVLAATAPTMLVLVIARFVQGIGGGGLYVVSLATVAKTYPERIRPRVMALLASMWILPGLLGPPVGALLAETVGWRWAFLAPLPLIVFAVALVMPSLRGVRVSEDASKLPVAASLVLMLGAGSLLAGLDGSLGVEHPARPRRARRDDPGAPQDHARRHAHRPRGLPAASAAAFLASAAFFAIDGFVTLMLMETRGLSIGVAEHRAHGLRARLGRRLLVAVEGDRRLGRRRLTAVGAMLIGTGAALVAIGLLDVPVVVPYVGWAIGSVGMGIVLPTIPLSVMGEVEEGREAGELSSMILMDYLGVGHRRGPRPARASRSRTPGRSRSRRASPGAFAVGILAAVLLALVARRLPDRRA